MKHYPNNELSLAMKCCGISMRAAILVFAIIGLSACGGSTVDSATALISLGNTGPVSNSGSAGSGASVVGVSVDLSWNAPTTRVDNVPIVPSDIGGYRIYFGTDQSNMQLLADINDASVTDYATQPLSSGTYYFAVSAYDSVGAEGRLSNIAEKVIL